MTGRIKKMSKLIIAGSRHFDSELVSEMLPYLICGMGLEPTEIVSGRCKGVDIAGELFAERCKLKITAFAAQWNRLGKAAGPIRNKQMAEYGDELLIIWDGSPGSGSSNMKLQMEKLGKPVNEVIIREAKSSIL